MKKILFILIISSVFIAPVFADQSQQSTDDIADLRQTSASSDSKNPSSDRTMMVVETDSSIASQSLNRISGGDIDPGWGVRGSDSHFVKSDDQQAPSPFALEKKYNPDPYYQSDKNNQ